MIFFNLKGLIILPILSKNLGASEYGFWTLSLATITFLQPFLLIGLDNAMLRFLPSKNNKEIMKGLITVFIIVIFICIFTSTILCLSSTMIANYILGDKSLDFLIKIIAVLLPSYVLSTILLGSFRIFGQIKRYSIILFLESIVEISLLSYFIYFGYGLIGALISILITKIIFITIMALLIISYAGLSKPDFSIIKPYLKYGIPLIPTLIAMFVISSSDRYIIGYFLGTKAVGIYSASYSIASIIAFFSSVFLYVLRPKIFNLFDNGKKSEVKSYLTYSMKYIMMFCIPSFFGLTFLSRPILMLLTTSEFISIDSIIIIPIVSCAILIYIIGQIYSEIIKLYKQTIIFSIVVAFVAAINVVLNIILIPFLGITAAAITTLIAYAIMAILLYFKSKKYLRFELNTSFILKSLFSSSIMGILIFFANPMNVYLIFLTIFIGALIYFSIIIILKGLNKNEIKFFIFLLKGIFRKKNYGK